MQSGDTYSGTTCLICGLTYPSTALAVTKINMIQYIYIHIEQFDDGTRYINHAISTL